MSHWRRFGMPLLVRELLEQSARKRTWVLRAVYAVLLYTPFVLLLKVLGHRGPLEVQGFGHTLFLLLILAQMIGSVLLLPAMTAGAIASEKERNTLEVLLVTGLSPSAIVLEKLSSRLVPVLSFLLLGAPLLPLVYAYGGVTGPSCWLLSICCC